MPICFGTNLLGSLALATRIYTLGCHKAIFQVPGASLIYFGTNERRCERPRRIIWIALAPALTIERAPPGVTLAMVPEFSILSTDFSDDSYSHGTRNEGEEWSSFEAVRSPKSDGTDGDTYFETMQQWFLRIINFEKFYIPRQIRGRP